MEVDSEHMRMRLMPSPVQCLNAIKVRSRLVSPDSSLPRDHFLGTEMLQNYTNAKRGQEILGIE